ncbi:hypothetical protein OH76DRAFT_1414782 [Lentinus brumalis]|uniref:RING-type domain-containing protein n=1 Tax=Lentinus brumalis TaxID=2498619 RepID=A0A371DSB1_9APHY|nr:hypothetical protein OH76DRAFT_1414782 [Polyporus brumalis]
MQDDGYNYVADLARVVAGEFEEYIVTHPGRSQYSQTGGGVSACGIAALNCARLVLGFHATGLGTSQLVEELMRRQFLEEILQPCLTWTSSTHLAVDEIHKAPIFSKSLKSVHSDYGQPTFDYFKRLLTTTVDYSKKYSASSCVIITRPPEIIACFYLARASAELFVVFDSHPRPDKHPHGAAFIFKNSLDSTAKHLTDLLRFDEHLLSDSSIQWQAQLLAHASGEIFLASEWVLTNAQWAEAALEASLQVLDLQARVQELESQNHNLETDNKRLSEEMSDLEEQKHELEETVGKLKEKTWETGGHRAAPPPSSRTSDASHTLLDTPSSLTNGRLTLAPRTVPRSGVSSSHHELPAPRIDPLAAQLQRDFDAENTELERQILHLRHTQPAFFDCGEDHVARVMPCGHLYCRPCLRDWAVSKITDHRYPILCPTCLADRSRSDPGEIDDMAVQQLGLGDKQYEIFSEMQLARFSTIVHCRKCKQTIFVDKAEYQEAQEIVCPLPRCGYAWCKTCSQAIEIGGPKHSCDGCQTPADKIDGCNHMTDATHTSATFVAS